MVCYAILYKRVPDTSQLQKKFKAMILIAVVDCADCIYI